MFAVSGFAQKWVRAITRGLGLIPLLSKFRKEVRACDLIHVQNIQPNEINIASNFENSSCPINLFTFCKLRINIVSYMEQWS